MITRMELSSRAQGRACPPARLFPSSAIAAGVATSGENKERRGITGKKTKT
jgi:hypothetical protein